MRGPFARAGTMGRFIGQQLGRRWSPPSDPACPTTSAELDRALASLMPGSARPTVRVEVSAAADWLDSGVDLSAGDEVTLLTAGRLWLSKLLDVGLSARVVLWTRVGPAGRIAKLPGDTGGLTVERGGRLYLVAKPPGEWLDDTGRFDPAESRGTVSGSLAVGVIVWANPAARDRELAAASGGPLAAEAARRAAAHPPPDGWRPHWRLGDTGVYGRARVDGRDCITCRTDGDVGILQHEVDWPLDESTRVGWSWRVRRLPSTLPEDTQPTHDYLSLAVAFDNGRDLTWMWSSGLEPGTSFPCPLPWWCHRETHLVVRSGSGGLGVWQAEERDVLADYRAAIGGAAPTRIVAVWLIAVSVFQQGVGEGEYTDIRLTGTPGTRSVR